MCVWDAVLPDDDLGVHAGCVDAAKDLGHSTDRTTGGCGPPCQLHGDHVARRGAPFLPAWNEDVHEETAVERHDIAHPVVVAVVAADCPLVGTLQNPNDSALDAAALLDAFETGD